MTAALDGVCQEARGVLGTESDELEFVVGGDAEATTGFVTVAVGFGDLEWSHRFYGFGYETGCVQKSRVSKGGIPKVYTPPF